MYTFRIETITEINDYNFFLLRLNETIIEIIFAIKISKNNRD